MNITWKVLVVSLLVVFLTGFLGTLAMKDSVNTQWYLDNKPSFTPPNYVFGPVWTTLYILIAGALYLSWTKAKKKEKKKVAWAYGTNLILNALWSFLFFGLLNPLLALLEIVILWMTIFWMIKVSYKIDKRAAWMLVPYLLWVAVAILLNAGFLF
ncbi:MAG: TspO/MBR family protein [archaeon]